MKNIFVSSTFRDFQYERDCLRNQVIPALNETARKYGESVDFCDLRWGVDTTEEYEKAAEKVISVCLDEIDRSRPYMLILLGERYGFVPDPSVISREARKRKLELEEMEISVTQLEIEYGIMNDSNTCRHTLIYFREIREVPGKKPDREYLPENEDYRRKMSALKERLLHLGGAEVRFYRVDSDKLDDLDEFAGMVQRDFLDLLEDEWKRISLMNVFEKDSYAQWRFLEEKAKYFSAGRGFADQVIACLEDEKETDPVMLTGESGSGKTTCFSYICSEMKERKWDVIPMLCGNTSLSVSREGLLKSVVWQMEKLLGEPHLTEDQTEGKEHTGEGTEENNPDRYRRMFMQRRIKKRLSELCTIYEKTDRHLLIAFDGPDQLSDMENLEDSGLFPDESYRNVRWLVTGPDTLKKPVSVHVLSMPVFEDEDKNAVIEEILAGKGKQLSSVVKTAVLEKKSASNPLYLYLLINRMCLMNAGDFSFIGRQGGSIDAINQRQLELVGGYSDNLPEMSRELLFTVAEMLDSKMPGSKMIERCLQYTGISRYGLRLADLEVLLKEDGDRFVPVRFLQMVHFISELFLLRNDGRYDFMHRSLREGICGGISDKKEIHRRLACYFLLLPEQDPIRQQEVLYHMICAGMTREAMNYAAGIGENTVQAGYAAETIYCQCMKDHGAWVLSTMNSAGNDLQSLEDLCGFWSFLECEVSKRFRDNRDAMEIWQSVLEEALPLLEKLAEERTKKPAEERTEKLAERPEEKENYVNGYLYRILYLAYEQMGKNLELIENAENFGRAYEYYRKEISICEALADRYKSAHHYSELAVAYDNMGSFLNSMGDDNNREDSLEFLEKAAAINREIVRQVPDEIYIRNLALACGKIARIHLERRRTQDIEQAIKLLGEAEMLMRSLVEKNPSPENRFELAAALGDLGSVYRISGGRKNIETGIRLYEEALKMNQELYTDLHSVRSLGNLVNVYLALGETCEKMEEQVYDQYALSCYKKALAYAEKSAQSSRLSNGVRKQISVCNAAAELLVKTGEEENMNQALQYLMYAGELAAELYEKTGTYINKILVGDVLCRTAKVYELLGTRENLEAALELYQLGREVYEELDRSEFTSEAVSEKLSSAFSGIGHVYKCMGGVLNFRKARPYYEKSMEITGKIMEKYGEAAERKRNIEVGNHEIGEMYLQTGDWEKGMEYLQKGLQIAEQLKEKNDSVEHLWDLSYSLRLNGQGYLAGNQTEEALECYRKALEIRRLICEKRDTPGNQKSLMISYQDVAEAYLYSGNKSNWYKAGAYMKKACEIAEKLEKICDTLEVQRNIAEAYVNAGDYFSQAEESEELQEALEYYIRGIRIFEKIMPEIQTYRVSVECISAYGKTAHLYMKMGDDAKTEAYFARALDAAEQFLKCDAQPEYKLMIPDIYMDIAEYYEGFEDARKLEKCERMYKKCIEIYEEVLAVSEDDSVYGNLASIYFSAGELYSRMEQPEKALPCYEKNVEITQKLSEDNRTQQRIICSYTSCGRMGYIYAQKEEFRKALGYFARAIKAETDAIMNLKDESSAMEILVDLQRDAAYMAVLCIMCGEYDQAMKNYDLAIQVLMRLAEAVPVEFEMELAGMCKRQAELMMECGKEEREVRKYIAAAMNIFQRYPGYSKELADLAEMLAYRQSKELSGERAAEKKRIDLYEFADAVLSEGREEQALELYQRYAQLVKDVPVSDLSAKEKIYRYNCYSQMGFIYIQRKTRADYERAIHVLDEAVRLEKETLKIPEMDNRKEEIMSDLKDDCNCLIQLREGLQKFDDVERDYRTAAETLQRLAEEAPDRYLKEYVQMSMKYAVYLLGHQGNVEKGMEILAECGELVQKYPGLEEEAEALVRMLAPFMGE